MLVGLLLLVGASARAQTAVSGSVSVDTHWTVASSPYVLSGDVVVQNGALLTIDPGVTVYMAANASLTVQAGGIQAVGTLANPIQVLSDKARLGQAVAPGDWNQWIFNPGTVNTRLDHVSFDNASGLAVLGCSPIFNFLSLRNHQGAAITVDLAASPSGVGNRASGNTVNGIAVPAGDISGSVVWALKGIPYVVAGGTVSVGQSPAISGIEPNLVPRGESVEAVIAGVRLDGLDSVSLGGGLNVVVKPGATNTSIPVTITAPESAPLGGVGVWALVAAGRAELAGAVTVGAKRAELGIDSLTPLALRRGQMAAFAATGANLAGATVATTVPGLTVSDIATTASTVNFNLTASAGAPLGSAALDFSSTSSAGKVAKTINVRPTLPTAFTSPAQVGLPASGSGTLTVKLSNADDVEHTFSLTMANLGLATVSPASIAIAANSTTSATVTVTAGAVNGATTLQIASTDGSGLAPVSTTVMVGQLVQSVSPKLMLKGTGPNVLSISGFGLGAATSVKVNTVPNSNSNHASVTLGALQAAPDGSSLSIPVTLAADAPTQAFYVTVWQGTSAFGLSAVDVDRMDVVAMNSEVFAQPAGVDVGGLGGTVTTQVYAVPAGVDVGGLGGTVMTQVYAAPAGVDVGGLGGTVTTQVYAVPAGVDVGGLGGTVMTQVYAAPAGVDVGGLGGTVTTQVYAVPAGVDVGPVLTVTGGLAAWLKADAGVTVTSGKVTGWSNQAGGIGNASPWGGIDGPVLTANALNGKPVMRFDGTRALQMPSTVLSSQQYTVIAVVNDTRVTPVSDFDYREIFSNWHTTNTTTSVFLGVTGYGGKNRLRFTDCMGGFNSPNLTRHGVAAIGSPSQHFVLTGLNTSDNAHIYVNDQRVSSRGFAIPSRSYTTPFAIGRQGSGPAEYWKGDIAELLVFDRALSVDAELPSVWNYLKSKYNLGSATGLETDDAPVGYCPGVGSDWFN